MRNVYLKQVRHEWKTSRYIIHDNDILIKDSLFLGRNRVMAKALGTTSEEEYQPNLSQLANVKYFFNLSHILRL